MNENDMIIGNVDYVNNKDVIIRVINKEIIENIKTNDLIWIRSTMVGQAIIGVFKYSILDGITVTKSYKCLDWLSDQIVKKEDIIIVRIVGTYFRRIGTKKDIFKEEFDPLPVVSADCFLSQKKWKFKL